MKDKKFNSESNLTFIQLMLMFKTERVNPETMVNEYAKESDFEPIYREIKEKAKPNVSNEFFDKWLQEYLTELVNDYKKGYKAASYDLELLFTIGEFIKWLNGVKTQQEFVTEYDVEKLKNIFDKLVICGVVCKSDKQYFVSIFNPPFKNRVYWDGTKRGAKVALFDLVERLTGRQYTTAEIQKVFNCEGLHDHNKPYKPTKMIDEVMK